MGRKKIEFDPRIFEQLASIHCTEDEISKIFQMDKKTLGRNCKRHFGDRFSVVYAQFQATGKVSLRRVIWKEGLEKKNPQMLKLLAANHLNMTDKGDTKTPVVEVDGDLVVRFQTLGSKTEKDYFDREE